VIDTYMEDCAGVDKSGNSTLTSQSAKSIVVIVSVVEGENAYVDLNTNCVHCRRFNPLGPGVDYCWATHDMENALEEQLAECPYSKRINL